MRAHDIGSSPLSRNTRAAVFYILAIAMSVFMFLPFFWSLMTSIKPDEEIFSLPIRWLPSHITFEHYQNAFRTVPFGLYFWNSFFLATMGVLTNLFFGSLSGYAFAKLRFRLNKPLFTILLAAMMIPGVVTLIPSFFVLKHLPLLGGNDLFGRGGFGLINSFWGVILPGASGSFAVFFMRQFFLTLPSDLMEMARIEGGGRVPDLLADLPAADEARPGDARHLHLPGRLECVPVADDRAERSREAYDPDGAAGVLVQFPPQGASWFMI